MEKLTSPQAMVSPKVQYGNSVVYFFLKRAFDLTLTTLALLPLLPLIIVLVILIRFDSPGKAIYKQKRIGASWRIRNGRIEWEPTLFTIYKFRTMKANAASSLHYEFVKAYINGDEERMARLQAERKSSEDKYKLAGDPRVTKIGKFLRKTSLDELPQLWNVLTGEMSLIGPRPPIPYEVEMYKPWHRQRLYTMPGITGLWQIKGRSSTTFDEMVMLDLEYIHEQSLWMDIKILLGTVPAVLMKKGAR